MTTHSIDQITGFLQESDLLWLLPNLRQDFVVWEALKQPEFFERLIQWKISKTDVSPEDFSPGRLALLALNRWDSGRKDAWALLDSIDKQLLLSSLRNLNHQDTFAPGSQTLEEIALTALALVENYRTTNSWSSLIENIENKPGRQWLSPLTCLYGIVGESAGLLVALVQPGANTTRIESAVHIVLSNPVKPDDQLDILLGLCHGAYGDLLPARERTMVVHSLSEQCPGSAVIFCRKWLELHPFSSSSIDTTPLGFIENLTQSSEILFRVLVNNIAGRSDNLAGLLMDEKEVIQQVSTAAITHYATQISKHRSDRSLALELSALRDQLDQVNVTNSSPEERMRSQAEMALILASKGFVDEATQLLPDADSPLPDDLQALYAIAVVSLATGDPLFATEALSKLMDIYDQNPQAFQSTVWGEGLSLVNLGKLLIELHKTDQAAKIFERACLICPNDHSLLKFLAQSYSSSYDYLNASETLRALVYLDPENISHRRLFAHSLESMGDWESGLNQRALMAESSQKQSTTLSLEDIYAYAKCALNANRPELTLQICADLVAHDSENYQALIYSGEAQLLIGETQKGIDLLTRATQVSPQESHGWLALADAQKKICLREAVIETLNNASRAVPESAEIHFSLGELYLQDDAPTLALPELKSAESLSPENPHILLSYAQALRQLGHTEDCRSVLSKAFQLDPHLPGLAQLYARLLVELNEPESAISPLEVLISKKPSDDPTPYMDYARCILALHKQGLTKYPPMKALIALNDVLQINSDLPEARALIAETLAANGDKEMAFQAYREALDTSLIEDRSWLERLSYGFGCVASSIGKHDIAIAALQEAAQVNPHNLVVFKALSDAYLAAGLPEDAIRAARNVLVINNDDPDNLAWFARQAEALIRREKLDPANPSTIAKSVPPEALNALAKAIHLAPTRTDLLVQLGYFQNCIDSQEEAQATFASIAALDFAAIDDLKTASDYLSSIGDHASAIACLENGISQDQSAVDNHDPSLYIKLAQEYIKNDDHTSAINTLDKAIQTIPGDETLFALKIDILLGLGQSIEALNCIEVAINSNTGLQPNAELLLLAARINRSMGDFTAAIKYVQKGIDATRNERGIADLSSLSPQCLTQIAEIYRALIQPDQAYKVLQLNSIVKVPDFTQAQDYLDFICLHTELALETGEQIRPDIQDIQPQPSDISFPRVMAITARLMNKAGNYKQAEQIYQIALNNYINHDYTTDLPAWSVAHAQYLTMHAIIETALDLGLWDQARNAIQQVMESYDNEPLSYLTFAKSIVFQAEFYNLCAIASVNKHNPSPDSLSSAAQIQFAETLEHCRSILNQHKDALVFNNAELTADSIDRWQARAIIAFNLSPEESLDPVEVLSHQHTPQDAAASIYYLRSHFHDREQDSTSQIIKVARSHSRHPAVLLQVALAIQDENPADACKSLQSVLDSNPSSKNPIITFCHIQFAKLAFSLNEYNLARKSVEAAISFWPDEPSWHELAAQICAGMSDSANVISHLLEATKLAPQNLTCQLALGKAYLESAYNDPRLLKQAQKSFENALEIEPKDVTALVSLANTQCLLNDVDNAELNARNALMLDQNRIDVYQLLSKIAIKHNDFQGAYEYANKAIQLNPKDIHSTIILAQSLSALGRHGEALAKLNAMLPATTDARLIYLERVNIIRKVNGIRAGVDELKSLVSSYPQDFNILDALAKSYVEAGEIDSAVEVAHQALKSRTAETSSNEQANLHLLIGQALRQSGELDQAIFHLNEAIGLAPDRLEPYIELGLARKERREYQQALQIFEQATSIDPEDPRAPFQAGLALKESKDYKSSEMMLRRAVSLAPNDLNIRRQLAAVVALNLVHNPRTGRI